MTLSGFSLPPLGRSLPVCALLLSCLGCASSLAATNVPPTSIPANSVTPEGDSVNVAPSESNADQPVNAPNTVSVFVLHQISDLDSFRNYFEQSKEARAEAGVLGYLLSQIEQGVDSASNESTDASAPSEASVQSETRIIIHFIAESMEKVDAFLASDTLEQLLDKAGSPDSTLLWKARDQYIDVQKPLADTGTYSLYSKFKIDDPNAWRKQFDTLNDTLRGAEVVATGIHISANDPNVIILHLVSADLQKLQALINDPVASKIIFAGPNGVPERPLIARDLMHESRRTP